MRRTIKTSLYLSLCALGVHGVFAAHPSRGLWVGEVALNAVNEATGAVGDSNTYEFSDPAIPTPTSDAAYLRLIVHVNGAGQAQLLKSVAIAPVSTDAEGSSDLVLLTNPELYPSYPGIATRVASAFYDFGDSHAVAAVQTIIDTVTDTAVARALLGDDEAEIMAVLSPEMTQLKDDAGVAIAYLDRGTNPNSFLTDHFFDLADVQAVADAVVVQLEGAMSASDFALTAGATSYDPFSGANPGGIDDVVNEAFLLMDTFYRDTRGIDAIVNLVEGTALAVEGATGLTTLGEKQAYARLVAEAAWHNAADIEQGYNRVIASSAFSNLADAVLPVAVQVALDAEAAGKTEAEIGDLVGLALGQVAEVQAAYAQAEIVSSESLWGDRRGVWAVDDVLAVVKTASAGQVVIDRDYTTLTAFTDLALQSAFDAVVPGVIFASAPSEAYSDFVASSEFLESTTTASEAAAEEASFQYAQGVTDAADLRVLTDRAVSKALIAEQNTAASLPKFQVTLNGTLEAGSAINGEFYLPALAPSNPFLHRLHPDHSSGFEITRRIVLTVDDGSGAGLASYGVSRLTGSYEEEIFGLHKALGPNQDIGLKTRGSFTLNRLTLADSLNF